MMCNDMMAEKRELYESIFSYFDGNGDGKMWASKLQQCIESIGGELSADEAEVAVVLMDSDGDGVLGVDDFVRLVEGVAEEERDNDLREAFKMYEMDVGYGFITPRSLKRMLRKLGQSRTLDDCQFMISQFDLDGDGVLNFDEFKVMMSC